MKKLLKSLAILAFISIAFVACGTPPPPPPKPQPKPVVQEPTPEPEPEPTPEPVPEPEPEPIVEEPREVPVQEYIVKKGDTLSQIALKFYGTREKAYYFPIIMATNPGVVQHPDKLTPKMKLLIPDYDLFLQHSPSKLLAKPEFKKCIEIYNSEGKSGMVESLKNRLENL